MRYARVFLITALLFAPIAAVAQAPMGAPTANDVAAQIKPDVPQVPVTDAKPAPFRIVNVEHGDATVSGGSVAGEIIMWLSILLGVPLAGFAVKLIVTFEKKIGVDVNDANRARLQEFIEHGIALGAQKAQVDLKGKLPIGVKSGVAVDALQYVQDHGVDTLKMMGIPDPTDPKVMEALQARIAKAMDDKLAAVTAASAPPAAPAAPATPTV